MRTLALIVALALLSAPLHAQGSKSARKPAKSHSTYVFDDDPMQGQSGFPNGQTIRVRPYKGRVLLIRPRAQFVQELRTSVEDI